MRSIVVTEEVLQKMPGLKLGVIEARSVRVQKEDERFEDLFVELARELKETFAERPLSSDEIIGHVRRMYRRVGWEPTKYRPSSEALARRILQGKDWYRINNLVDLGNLASARAHLPMGLYDADKIEGQIRLDVGKEDETYEGLSRKEIHAGGKLILRDERGIFGNPTADSKRTAIVPQTKNILAVFFTPPEVSSGYLEQTLNRLVDYYTPLCAEIEQKILEFV